MAREKYLKYNVKLLQFAGLFKVEHPAMVAWKFFCNFSLFYFTIASFVDILKNKHLGFNAIAINWVNVGIGALVTMRTNCYYLSVSKSERLVKEMNALFKYSSDTRLREKTMKHSVDITKKISFAWLSTVLIFGEGYAVAQMLLEGFGNRKLPYPMWYPYEWKRPVFYEITCLQQFICHMILIQVQCAADMFYASALILTVKQFELFGWELRNVVYTSLLESDVHKDVVQKFKEQFNDEEEISEGGPSKEKPPINLEVVYETVDSAKFNRRLQAKFKKLIEFHQKLMAFSAMLGDFFSPILLIYTLGFLIITLFALYYTITTDDQSVRIAFGGYIVLIPIDIVFTSFFGEMITTQTEQLQNDMYEMPWYICGAVFKKSFQIVHMRVGQPVTLTIGKFAKQNLNTSLWILRTAFSYAMVLRQMTK